jgi:hypothetical protein
MIIGARLCGLAQNIMHHEESHNTGSETYLMGKYAGTGPWNRANDGPLGGLFRSYRRRR